MFMPSLVSDALERPPPSEAKPIREGVRVKSNGTAFRIVGNGLDLQIIRPVDSADLDAMIETVRLWEDVLCRR